MKRLSKKELNLFKVFIKDYKNLEECLSDNFTCQCIEELRDITGLSNKVIGAILSSLQDKGIITLEERDGAVCKSRIKIQQMNFEPDLYWLSDEFLKSLNPELDFETLL